MKTILPCLAALLSAAPCFAADFREAVIVLPGGAGTPREKAAHMLTDEIEKRTQLRLPIVSALPTQGPAIVLGRLEDLRRILPPAALGLLAAGPAEGFTVLTSAPGAPALAIVCGNDDRGVLFGTGYLLRKLHMNRQRLDLDDSLRVVTAPKVPIRGHQLGYRPKTNAYDAWSVPMWEQYLRDLAVFGANTIELIPPRSDDDDESPHFPLPKMEMMIEMSRLANDYGLNVSIWYPAMDKDYSDPQTVASALKEWEVVFRKLPRIDAIFVPGGDPGHTEPKYLMALLEKQAASLRRYHPKAEVWISPQSFSAAWTDEFYSILDKEPAWLTGVVFGPQVRGSLDELRRRTPKRYPVRFYPDITHSIHSEFPVPSWDFAYASTEGREVINPRPVDEAAIFHRYQPRANAFVTYSEGCNDDVNKAIWSGLGWNPDANVKDILTDYGRYFIGDEMADSFAEGLLALERNWRGPLLANSAVDVTLEQFQDMERRATPRERLSWRFQEALYRAYYDAFLHDRLLAETDREIRALVALENAPSSDSLSAMDASARILDEDPLNSRTRALRARVFELAEALFQSIHMQLSVPRYQAIALGRGANLDAIDFPLNDRVWLENRFREIRALASEPERLAAIDAIVHWTDPGPGGFYDDLGDPSHQPHLVAGEPYSQDPDFLKSPLVGFGARSPHQGWRVSQYTDAESLFEQPLQMRYTGLDRAARYKLQVVYGGDSPNVPVRLVANGNLEIHGERPKGSANPPPKLEFELPPAATQSGTLTLEWRRPSGGGGNGRGAQVAEVWLVKVPAGETAR